MEIDHEIFSTDIPLLKKDCCHLHVKVCQACPGKSVVRLTDILDMTIGFSRTKNIGIIRINIYSYLTRYMRLTFSSGIASRTSVGEIP